MQVQNEVTLKSKLKADRRNADLQRRHDALKEQGQHAQRALESSQVQGICLSMAAVACSISHHIIDAKQH